MLITPETLDPVPPAAGRIFFGWNRDLLARAARLLVDRHREGDEIHLERAIVALPGGRASRRLKRLLAEVAQADGARLFPPRVITVGSLPEVLYPTLRPACTPATASMAWARAMRDTPPAELQRLLARPPAPSDLRGWTRAGARLAALHVELGGATLLFGEVADRCGAGLLFDDSDRWRALAGVQHRYRAALDAVGLADRDLARLDALRAGAPHLEGSLWLVGVAEMPEVARAMLRRVAAAGAPVTAVIQAPAEEAEGFDALGCLRPDWWTGRPIPLRDDQVAIRDRPADQAEEVVRALGGLDGRYAAEEIVIGVPDPSLVPVLEERLLRAGAAARPATGRPLGRVPLLRLLAAVAEHLAEDSFESCAALLRHPDLLDRLARDAEEDPDRWLEELDRYFTDHLPARFAAGGTLDRYPRLLALCERLRAPELLGRLAGSAPLREWVDRVVELVVEVYRDRILSADRPVDRELMESCDRLREAALELRALPPELDAECDAPVAIRILLDRLSGGQLRPPPREGAIELLGWLELRLDDAPVALVTAFNEPFLPECVNGDAYLPNALRERLGLVCNARRLARDAYELTALLHSREHLHLVAGRRSADGDPLRPSRLFLATGGPELAERVRRFHAPPTPIVGPTAPPQGERESDGFRMPRFPTLSAPEPIRTLRVTDFRQLLADPYRFALERVLGLESAGDADRELDGLAFGGIAHEVLQRFGRSPLVNWTDAAAARDLLDSLLDDTAAARLGAEPLPAPRVQVEQLRARLHRFARHHCARMAEGWRVVAVECGTAPAGAPIEVDGAEFRVRGRIDRIDHHAESGRWALLDYKTGDRAEDPEKTHRAGSGKQKEWKELQLPLYRKLLPHLVGPDGGPFAGPAADDPVQLGYLCLPATLDDVGLRFATWDQAALDEADRCADGVLRMLARNEFHFDPARARGMAKSPLGVLVGIGFLETAMEEPEENEEVAE